MKRRKRLPLSPSQEYATDHNFKRRSLGFTADQTKPQMAVIDTHKHGENLVPLDGLGYGAAVTKDGTGLLIRSRQECGRCGRPEVDEGAHALAVGADPQEVLTGLAERRPTSHAWEQSGSRDRFDYVDGNANDHHRQGIDGLGWAASH